MTPVLYGLILCFYVVKPAVERLCGLLNYLKVIKKLCTHTPKNLIWIYGVEQPDLFKPVVYSSDLILTLFFVWIETSNDKGHAHFIFVRIQTSNDKGQKLYFLYRLKPQMTNFIIKIHHKIKYLILKIFLYRSDPQNSS